jgi:malonyl-CoA O-methyltransferase
MQTMIDKTFVKKSFNVGAATYDDNAGLQKRLLESLLGFAGCAHMQPKRILDIGIGTANLSIQLTRIFPETHVYGCDLAENMLLRAGGKTAAGKLRLFAADVENLPLRVDSFDLVASSFTLQWLNSLDQAMREIIRILRPKGIFFFSAFGMHTFQELRSCYHQACLETGYDQGDALVIPLTRSAAEQALHAGGFAHIATESEKIIEYYDSVADLVRSIKGMGARNASPRRNRTLGVRRIWRRMVKLYEERYGSEGRIPATYEVIKGRGIRPL